MRSVQRQPARRHRWRRGQAIVEFSLVAPILFTALFGTVNGGLILFGENSCNHAAGVALIILSEEGRTATADTDAVSAIQTGMSNIPSMTIDEIDIYQLDLQNNGSFTQNTQNTNKYYINGTGNTIAWTPAARSTSNASLTNIGLTVKYHYNYTGLAHPVLNLTMTKYFRLEPRD